MSDATRSEPLVAAHVDLKDFPFMPLEVSRLRRSKAWLIAKKRPELGFYQINLWTASWHEKPCASLEDDDEVLADFAMCKPGRWTAVKATVMRGWVLCSDGRWYHPVVAEKANESWKAKVAQRERTAAATAAREAKRKAERELRDAIAREKSGGRRDVGRDGERDVERDVQRDVERDVHQGRGTGRVKGQGEGIEKAKGDVGLAPDATPLRRVNRNDEKLRELRAQAVQAIVFLNEKTGRAYEPVPAIVDKIVGILGRGSTLEDVRAVIARKCREWSGDPKMEKYLRPKTLFLAENFANYKGELVPAVGAPA